MPTQEDYYHPDTVYYRNGVPFCPRDRLMGLYEDKLPKRSNPSIKYSSRRLKRKQESTRLNSLAEPSSFAEAREKGRDFWWDSGE